MKSKSKKSKSKKKKRTPKSYGILNQKIDGSSIKLFHYVTTARKKYGLRYLNDPNNILEGKIHLNELTKNNPLGISLTFVNLSDSPIAIQYLMNGQWITPPHNSKGKDKYSWDNILPSHKFPKTDFHSIKQLTAYHGVSWQIIYKDTHYEIKHINMIEPKDSNNNKHIVFITDNKDKRFNKLTANEIEEFIKYQVSEGMKINKQVGYSSWNTN